MSTSIAWDMKLCLQWNKVMIFMVHSLFVFHAQHENSIIKCHKNINVFLSHCRRHPFMPCFRGASIHRNYSQLIVPYTLPRIFGVEYKSIFLYETNISPEFWDICFMAVVYLSWRIVLTRLHNPPLKLLVMSEANLKGPDNGEAS
jgi:hypothetical protein